MKLSVLLKNVKDIIAGLLFDTSTIGTDISHWQGAIDFVKMYAAGARFTYMKASQALWTDDKFKANWQAAKGTELKRGAYHFLDWSKDAAMQATYFWSLLQDDPGELLPCVDFEWNPGLSTPSDATARLKAFCVKFKQISGLNLVIYTSTGFWTPLKDFDSEWTSYPLWVAHYTTGIPLIPVPWKIYAIHQYTGSGPGATYGVSSAAIDLDRSGADFDRIVIETVEEPMTDWKLNAIMLYTKTATWSNTGFNAIIGHAGQSWDVPNPDLKPIETKAAAEGKPFLALWDFDVDYYSVNQIMGDDAHWPAFPDDYPLQMFIRALTSRDPKAVIVRVLTEKNRAGKTEDPGYIAYAAKRFMGRAGDWLAANKPGAKLMIGTNNDFISRFAPNMNNWAYEYPSFIIQPAVLPLDLSFPQPTDKVKNYISVRPTWEMWHYYDTTTLDLVLYNGTKDQLYTWLGFGVMPADTQPPTIPTGLAAQVSGDKITLAWQPSTDNVGVTGYKVYDGYGVLLAQTTITSWSVSGKLPGTYVYAVSALDAAGNESGKAVNSVTVPDIEEPVNLAELLALTKENTALLKEIRAVFR